MTGSRRDLAAAASVEAACGLAAASWVNALGGGHSFFAVFAACAVAAAVADMVLVPGSVWGRGSSVALQLLGRTVAASVTLVVSVVVATWSLAPIFALSGIAGSFGGWEPGIGGVMLGMPFLVGGAGAGLGAALADAANPRPGLVQARFRSHVAGGIAGAVLVLALALASIVVDAEGSGSWHMLFVLAPTALVVGGGLRHALMMRDAARTGTALAAPGPVAARAAACCAACFLAAAAAFVPDLLPA